MGKVDVKVYRYLTILHIISLTSHMSLSTICCKFTIHKEILFGRVTLDCSAMTAGSPVGGWATLERGSKLLFASIRATCYQGYL